jgi:hypothetical protein
VQIKDNTNEKEELLALIEEVKQQSIDMEKYYQ